MKQFLIFSLFMSGVYGCDPVYHVSVRNSTPSVLYFKTYPTVESLLFKSNSGYYDSVLKLKINNDSLYGVYKLIPSDSFILYEKLGKSPSENDIPFIYIKFFNSSDSIVLDSKSKIFNQIKPVSTKRRKYYFDLQKLEQSNN